MKTRIVCALVLIIGVAQFVQADWWVIGIGRLQVLMREAVYTQTYAGILPTTGDFTAAVTAQEMTRAEADNRISDAVQELCYHDYTFCADVFARYGLRWQSQ